MSGIPNQPVESNPAKVSVIKRYRAKLWYCMLKNKQQQPLLWMQQSQFPRPVMVGLNSNLFARRLIIIVR